MKKLLSVVAVVMGFSTAASLRISRLSAKAALPMPVIFSWTGCYVGAVGGWNQGHSEQIARASQTPVDGLPLTGKFDMTGSIAGGTIGCTSDQQCRHRRRERLLLDQHQRHGGRAAALRGRRHQRGLAKSGWTRSVAASATPSTAS